jgi:hypothetical protein
MKNDKGTVLQSVGIAILVLTIGAPAMNYAGFEGLMGLELNWDLATCLAVATVGGAIGGALLGDKHPIAGLFGGLLAGPSGFLALHFYLMDRESVRTFETLLVQLAGSLPGIAVFHLLKRFQPSKDPEREMELAFAEERSN